MCALTSLEMENSQEISPSMKFLGLTHQWMMDQLPEGVFLVNTRWQLHFFNEMAQSITGFSREEALGKFCWDIFRSDQCHKNCPMRVSMSTGDVLVDREVEITTKAGLKKLVVVNTAQLRRLDNLVIGGVETFHQLTCPELETERLENQVFGDIVGVSPRMQEIIHSLPVIAASGSNVLIQGESGTA